MGKSLVPRNLTADLEIPKSRAQQGLKNASSTITRNFLVKSFKCKNRKLKGQLGSNNKSSTTL